MSTRHAPVDQRAEVWAIAASQPETAVKIARSITNPWYRCQALSYAAMHTKDPETRRAILEESLRAAGETGEPNRIVSVSAWPLNVLLECDEPELFSQELQRLLMVLQQEPHPLKRQDALFTLVWHIKDMRGQDLDAVLGDFKTACMEGHGSRTERNLKWMAELLSQRAPDWSAEFETLLLVKRAIRRDWKASRQAEHRKADNQQTL